MARWRSLPCDVRWEAKREKPWQSEEVPARRIRAGFPHEGQSACRFLFVAGALLWRGAQCRAELLNSARPDSADWQTQTKTAAARGAPPSTSPN